MSFSHCWLFSNTRLNIEIIALCASPQSGVAVSSLVNAWKSRKSFTKQFKKSATTKLLCSLILFCESIKILLTVRLVRGLTASTSWITKGSDARFKRNLQNISKHPCFCWTRPQGFGMFFAEPWTRDGFYIPAQTSKVVILRIWNYYACVYFPYLY